MEDKFPKVSIVIPHFNRENIIIKGIESIRQQTYNNWECLVVDDGSSEESKQSLRAYLNNLNDDRFHFVERPSSRAKGANACRNMGVENGTGKYIAFLDSDDSWSSTYLQDAIDFAEKQPGFVASYSGAFVNRNGKITEKPSRPVQNGEGLFDFILSPGVLAQTSSYFLLRSIALQVRFDESLRRHQDYDYFIALGSKYSWSYNPTCRTNIDWSTISSRKTDFASCVTVYQRHKAEFKNPNIQQGYLISLLGLALKENAESRYISFYQKELKHIGYRKKIGLVLMINFPYVYRFIANARKRFGF